MMLFESMPLTLHSNKRKGVHSHEGLPLPKKIALEHQSMPKYGRSKASQSSDWSISMGKCAVSNGACVNKTGPSLSEDVLGRRTSLDSKLECVSSTQQTMAGHQNGNGHDHHDDLINGEDYRMPKLLALNEQRCELGSDTQSEIQLSSLLQNNNGGVMVSSLSTKQPALKKTKKSGHDKALAEYGNKNLFAGGYMRRMASLNASACVAAMMEPDKKTRTHKSSSYGYGDKIHHICSKRELRSISVSSSDDSPSPIAASRHWLMRSKDPSLSPAARLSSSSISSEADTSQESCDSMDVTGTLMALASRFATLDDYVPDEVQYNRLGLLYNGDTIHPAARVFYTSDTDLTLPARIIPTVVPSQLEFVKSAISDAQAQQFVKKKRKAAKANNGWTTMGNPVKTVEYEDGSHFITRRYYAGISRNNAKEVIFIRDSILIRSGDTVINEEKPYVAKIASIWQEQPGQLMMTVFWYYRPHELDGLATQGTFFQENELLASQHNDDNSVACIEEKCYVLGTSQYCRYQAYTQSKKGYKTSRHDIVPHAKPAQSGGGAYTTEHLLLPDIESQYFDCTSRNSKKVMAAKSSKTAGPELVYLCQRGYNHCAARLVSKSAPK